MKSAILFSAFALISLAAVGAGATAPTVNRKPVQDNGPPAWRTHSPGVVVPSAGDRADEVLTASSPKPALQPARAVPSSQSVVARAEAAGNTAYEQAITAYMENVLKEAQARQSQERNPGASQGRPPDTAAVDRLIAARETAHIADLPQVEAILIGRKALARLASADGGLLVVGVGDVTRYGTVTRIDSEGVWMRPGRDARPIMLEDLTPSEASAASRSSAAASSGNAPYGSGSAIVTPPIPISPAAGRLPSGVSGD